MFRRHSSRPSLDLAVREGSRTSAAVAIQQPGPHRVVPTVALALALASGSSLAQVPQPEPVGQSSYWHNTSLDNVQSAYDENDLTVPDFGEFAVDIGGHIPFGSLNGNQFYVY